MAFYRKSGVVSSTRFNTQRKTRWRPSCIRYYPAFEDTVLEALNRYPKARAILVIGSGINEIDASGEEKVRDLVNRLREDGIALMFSSLKAPVAEVFQRAGLMDLLGADNVFASKDIAIDDARRRFDPVPAT